MIHSPVIMKDTGSSPNLFVLAGVMVACLSSGCKSASQYVSPRVEGRVLDSQSHQPIKDVEVRRLSSDENYRSDTPPKGGELMIKTPSVRTAADGTFALDSRRDVALLQRLTWYSVSLSFQHPGYMGLQMMYTQSDATNNVKGEPLVKAGDILLTPRAK